MRPISAMNFASSTMRKRRLGVDASATCEPKAFAEPAAPTEDEWMRFFATFVDSGHRPAVAMTNVYSEGEMIMWKHTLELHEVQYSE